MQSIEHLGVGDTVLTDHSNGTYGGDFRPHIKHDVWVIARLTKTQAEIVREGDGKKIMVRRDDSRVVGKPYDCVMASTPELLAANEAEVKEFGRYFAAERKLDDLFDKRAHQLKLSTDEIEYLAEAWTHILESRHG